MGKGLKWILGIVGFLVVVLIVITLSLPLLIDPNDYKDTITAKVREQTGRELTIPGDIKLDVSLIGLKTVFSLGEIRLSSSEDFPDTTFFAGRHAEVSLALWPLITSKELQINTVRLEGVELNLVRDSQGRTNWQDLAAGGGGQPPAEAPAPETGPQKGAGLAGIDIGGVVIKDINASFVDRQQGMTARLDKFNLELGRVQEGSPFPMQADFQLFYDDGKAEPLTAQVNTASTLTLSVARQHFLLEGFSLDAVLKGGQVPGGEMAVGVAGEVEADIPAEKVEARQLTVSQGEMQVETSLTMTGFAKPQIEGTLAIPQFSPRAQAESLDISLPLEKPDSMTSMTAKMDFSYDPSGLTVPDLLLTLDETTMKGNLAATLGEKPAYEATLHINQLNLDNYKMKKSAEPAGEKPAAAGEETTVPAPAGAEEAPLLPVEQLRKLTFKADVTMDSLTAAKMRISSIRLAANGREGLIKLEPLAADLYQGTLLVTGNIDARPDSPRLQINKKLSGVELGPMFVDLVGKEEVKGRADITAEVKTEGLTRKELTANSNGTFNLSMADGEIARLKIIDTIRTARAMLGSREEQKTDGGGETQKKSGGKPTTFANLTGSGTITDGVIRNNDLLAQSELMKVEGKGTVNLNTEEIDYLLTIYLARKLDRDEETGLVDLTDTPIPYRVKGTFGNIQQSAALGEIVKSQAKKTLFKEIEKQLGGEEPQKEGTPGEESSSGDPKDLLKKGLKGLFGN